MDPQEKKRLHRLAMVFSAAAAAGAGLLALYLAGVPVIRCPFNLLTRLSCPGCGNIRAAAALLRLRFTESLTYNYAYPAEFAYLLWVAGSAAKKYIRSGRFSYHPK